MRIIQITDSHISIDTPQRTADLKNCVQHVNDVYPPPDLVIHTGDIVHEGASREYEIARSLLDTLEVPYAVLAGNKDRRPELMAAFGDNRFLQNITADSVRGVDEFIQYSIEDYPVRLIVLDTLGTASKGEFCENRLQHLDAMLKADLSRPAVVFMHHPPVEVIEIPDPLQFADWADVDSLLKLLGQYPQLQSVYCGHIHRNVDLLAGKLPVNALTCMACDLRKGQLSKDQQTRPMFKVVDLACQASDLLV